MSIVSDALIVGSYVVGSIGAAALIGVQLTEQAIEENATVIVADQVVSVTLSIEELSSIIPPCEQEDTVPVDYACLWDASTRGNNGGDSFIVRNDGRVFYLSE